MTKQKLPPEHDRRRKLTDEDRAEIRRMYFRQGMGVRAIAREYSDKCSRRLIQFVLFPERAEKNAQNYKDRDQAAKTYERVRGKQWAKTMREHRKHRAKVFAMIDQELSVDSKTEV